MPAQVFVYLIPYLISLTITIGLGAFAWRRKDVIGARAYASVMVGQSLWILGYIFELLTPTLEGKIFWDDLQFFGGFVWVLAFLAFTFQYAGVHLRKPILVWSLIGSLPVLLCLLILSNPLHGLVRSSAWLVPGDPFDELDYDFTPAVLAWAVYGLGCVVVGLGVLARRYLGRGGVYRAQVGTIILGTMVPLLGVTLTTVGVTVTFHRDTTPFTFAVGSSIVMWGLFRYRLFDVVPAARNFVVESMPDAVVIVDARGWVVDLNQAAARLLNCSREQAIGQVAETLFSIWTSLVHEFWDREQFETEIVLDIEGEQRHFDVRLSPVSNPRGRSIGRLIVVRNITARKHAEAALTQERDLIAAILDTAGALVLVLDPAGEIVRFNQACEQMTGYTQAEVRGKQVWGLFVPDQEVMEVKAALERVRPGAKPVLHENQWIARDGTLRRIAWSNTALLDEDGEVRYIISIGIDVEEERRRQQEANALADTARLVSSTLDLGEVLEHTAKQTMDILQADRCLIGLYEADKTLRCAAVFGFSPALALSLREQELEFTDRTRQTVLEAMAPLTIPDIETDPRVGPNIARSLGIQSALLVPIEVGGQGLGLILLGTQLGHKRTFTEAEEKLARAMASQAAMAISNARWYASLQDELAARIQAERALLVAQQDLERRVQERTADLAAANESLRAEIQERERAEQERKRAQEERDSSLEALHDSEDRFRSLVQQLSDIVFVIDPDTRIQYATPSCQEILGYGPADMMGNLGLEYVHPEDVEYLIAEMGNIPDREAEILAPVEFRLRHKDGHWVHFEAKATNLLSVPSVGGIVITARDITERRRLEAQFFQAQKMEAVGRLAGGIAHDFNNLLTAIQGYTLFLLNDLQVDDPALWPSGADLRSDLSEIAKASERATALTKQLLAFSRKQVMESRILDLNDIVNGIEPMLRRLIGEDIDLETHLAPSLGSIRADPGQIEQVIVNLVVNARDAMPEGGQLTIETGNVLLDQVFAREHPGASAGSHVWLAVRDTGTGMDQQVLDRLFEPFFTTKPAGQGTGLGLATVYGIVKQSDGYIWPSSKPGHGSTFEVYLPRIDQDADAETPEQKVVTPEVHSGTETILIVEDEPMVRELSGRVLEDLGYVVVLASHPQEGLDYVEQHANHIDLLITDVIMPGMSGKDLAGRVLELRPGLRVLYISGYTDDAIVDHGVLSPELDFLAKPFTPDALARKVRQVLDQPR